MEKEEMISKEEMMSPERKQELIERSIMGILIALIICMGLYIVVAPPETEFPVHYVHSVDNPMQLMQCQVEYAECGITLYDCSNGFTYMCTPKGAVVVVPNESK